MTKPIKYKKTGLKWYPQIPEHWEVRKISQGFKTIGSGTTPSTGNALYYENGIYNWLQTGDLTNNVINRTSRKITQGALDDYPTLRFYKRESLVIAMYGATIGKVGILNIETTTNQACCVLSNSSIWVLKYIYYWFISNKRHIITLSYGGGQPNISQQTIRDLRIPLPPLTEQEKIADYLDRKTSLIDSIISKKEKQIELYKEERTAVINHAVTKGLNPNVEMKDSGIEWLGSIPKHWEVKKLKHLLTNRLEYGANESAEQENQKDPRYLRITDFDNNGTLRSDTFKSLPSEIAEPFLLKEGDILFARSGATVGKTFLFSNYKGLACFAGYLIRARHNEKILPMFLYLYTKSGAYNSWKNSVFIQATIQNIGAEKYSMLGISLPPITEQQEIVTYLDNETNRIDTLVSKTSKQIELLKEYKEALINEVVTGQRIID